MNLFFTFLMVPMWHYNGGLGGTVRALCLSHGYCSMFKFAVRVRIDASRLYSCSCLVFMSRLGYTHVHVECSCLV